VLPKKKPEITLKSYVRTAQVSSFLHARKKNQNFSVFLKKNLANEGFFDEHLLLVNFMLFRQQ